MIANFSLSNDAGGDVDFSALSMAETLQAWVPIPEGANPYETDPYEFNSGNLYFRTAPAGETYANGATISWDLAFDVSNAPATYPRKISLRPEEGNLFGQFSYTMLTASFSCSEGEPFYAEITEAEAGLGEIELTAYAFEGSAAITSYDATCEDTSGNETDASSTGTSIVVPELEGGEDYTCTVTATNSVGTSTASDPTETLTPTSSGLPVWLLHEASTP
ncbi:MAG: fibronectin type III domain-containing protein [Luminiphilus sp.]